MKAVSCDERFGAVESAARRHANYTLIKTIQLDLYILFIFASFVSLSASDCLRVSLFGKAGCF